MSLGGIFDESMYHLYLLDSFFVEGIFASGDADFSSEHQRSVGYLGQCFIVYT